MSAGNRPSSPRPPKLHLSHPCENKRALCHVGNVVPMHLTSPFGKKKAPPIRSLTFVLDVQTPRPMLCRRARPQRKRVRDVGGRRDRGGRVPAAPVPAAALARRRRLRRAWRPCRPPSRRCGRAPPLQPVTHTPLAALFFSSSFFPFVSVWASQLGVVATLRSSPPHLPSPPRPRFFLLFFFFLSFPPLQRGALQPPISLTAGPLPPPPRP